MQSRSTQEMHQASQALLQSYQKAVMALIENHNKDPEANFKDLINISNIYQQWLTEAVNDPSKWWQAQYQWWKDSISLFEQVQEKMAGKEVAPKWHPQARDRRFNNPQWQENPWFYLMQQSYLLLVQHCQQFLDANPSRDPKISKQVNFFTQQFLDAVSPTNFIFSNPDALEHTMVSRGENLTKGYKNFLDDIARGQGHFMIKMTDMNAFTIGENIALTPGKIIFQNRLLQLIQYTPSTDQVFERPLLMIPPWINKYYILDLRERNSLVKWAVDQGFTVFMISWLNPGEEDGDISFDDYMLQGVMAAIEPVLKVTQQTSVNALGFCVGGTLLSCTLAYMARMKDKRIHSATFLSTLIDFSDPGDISVFIDEPQIEALEKRMETEGYLDGRLLMNSFNLLRSNDLMWSYYVNNYLFGQDPLPFDLLFWNSDSTNLPASMHSFYLRNMYLNNYLIAGKLTLAGQSLDLSQVTIPCYFLSTEQDHIAPWPTTFIGAQKLQGNNEFVLGGSGHIAGIINPPCNHKYGYKTTDGDPKQYKNADDWYVHSQAHEGSWWGNWTQWLAAQSGKQIKARVVGENTQIIQDAPGEYVKKRIL